MPSSMKPASGIETVALHYSSRISSHAKSHDILDWASEEEQKTRFAVFAGLLSDSGLAAHQRRLAILDAGCGLADLKHYLTGKGFELDYVGVDIVEAMAVEAAIRSPGLRLAVADLSMPLPFCSNSFDAGFSSGAFNLEFGGNEASAAAAMCGMWDACRVFAAGSFLSASAPIRHDGYHYFDPEALVRRIAPRFRFEIIDDYLHKDFTLVLWK